MQDEIGLDKYLHFLALVELAAIPLYLLVKPHLDVWTDDEETEAWLTHCLLRDLNDQQDLDGSSRSPWWSRPAQQSDHGILLEVRNRTSNAGSPDTAITEFLIYACVVKSADSSSYLPSPPASSSPQRTNDSDESSHEVPVQKIRIRAVPLASTTHQHDYTSHLDVASTDSLLDDGEAYFIPAVSKSSSALPDSPPQRQKLLHLFEDATYQRKRLSRRGGEGISMAMAGLDGAGLHRENQRDSEPEVSSADIHVHVNTQGKIRERSLSRSLSTPMTRQMETSGLQSRTHLGDFANKSSLHDLDSDGSLRKTSALPTDMNNIEDQNRSALTRIVMAGMRIYGLQQRRKSIKLQSGLELGTDSPLIDASNSRGDEEYKLVYHQTFKAATFAFRNQISKGIINQAAMGDVVDQLLALFCSEGSAVGNTKDSFTSGFDRNQGE